MDLGCGIEGGGGTVEEGLDRALLVARHMADTAPEMADLVEGRAGSIRSLHLQGDRAHRVRP